MTFADQEENDIEENDSEEVQGVTTETGSEADDESSDNEESDSDKAEDKLESCDDCGCSDSAETDIAADENTETDIAADAEIDAAAAATDFPVASLEMLLMTHHTQAVMALGMMPDPMTGETSANKDAAKFHIDMLSVIEEKTKGNLTDEESEALSSILHQLRMAFFAS